MAGIKAAFASPLASFAAVAPDQVQTFRNGAVNVGLSRKRSMSLRCANETLMPTCPRDRPRCLPCNWSHPVRKASMPASLPRWRQAPGSCHGDRGCVVEQPIDLSGLHGSKAGLPGLQRGDLLALSGLRGHKAGLPCVQDRERGGGWWLS